MKLVVLTFFLFLPNTISLRKKKATKNYSVYGVSNPLRREATEKEANVLEQQCAFLTISPYLFNTRNSISPLYFYRGKHKFRIYGT